MIAGGTESMSMVPMMGHQDRDQSAPSSPTTRHIGIAYGMGITAEKVAEQWKVTREQQDAFAVASHAKALAAIAAGEFKDEIAPYTARRSLSRPGQVAASRPIRRLIDTDEGPRAGTTLEVLAKLQARCSARQVRRQRDGRQLLADVRRRRRRAARQRTGDQGLQPHAARPLRRLLRRRRAAGNHGHRSEGSDSEGAQADRHQAGRSGLDRAQRGVCRAGARCDQAISASIPSKVNPLGGAIALGHPLGATGAIRAATLIHGMRRRKQKYGMVTMCIGTGMGAAGMFEAL